MAWINTNPTEAITVREDRYWQAEGYHEYELSNGINTWTTYENAVFRIKERTTEYGGLTLGQAQSLAQTLGSAIEHEALKSDGSSVFEKYSKRTSITRANQCGAYNVSCIEKWTALYVNGERARGATIAQVE